MFLWDRMAVELGGAKTSVYKAAGSFCKSSNGNREMTLQLRGLIAVAENLGSVPSTTMEAGKHL